MSTFLAQPQKSNLRTLVLIVTVALLMFTVVRGFQWRNHWQQIESRGKLIVAVRESEGIYWATGAEFTGLEKDLLDELEIELNIPIQLFAVRDLGDLYHALEVGAVDMAIPGTSHSDSHWHTSLPYLTTQIGLVQNKKSTLKQPRTGILDPLSHQPVINQVFDEQNPSEIVSVNGRLSAELFTLVDMEELTQVLVDERDFKLQQSIFPDLKFSPIDLPKRDISILFNPSEDGSLLTKVNAALQAFDESGLLGQIRDRYFGQALEFDYVDNFTFEKHMKSRLPTYIDLFKEYGEQFDMDWRFLAAIAYQESHWRANAVSPTGVRGLMMITRVTAKEMGIKDRTDPRQSTQAGAQYLTKLKARLPDQIMEPDRSWFALASYNVGAGHLEDARKITDKLGGDPNRWIDVRAHLPKLALKDYYPWTKYGYARGKEPVVYVANIRRFYNRLKKEFPQSGESAEPERLDQLPNANVPVFPGL